MRNRKGREGGKGREKWREGGREKERERGRDGEREGGRKEGRGEERNRKSLFVVVDSLEGNVMLKMVFSDAD